MVPIFSIFRNICKNVFVPVWWGGGGSCDPVPTKSCFSDWMGVGEGELRPPAPAAVSSLLNGIVRVLAGPQGVTPGECAVLRPSLVLGKEAQEAQVPILNVTQDLASGLTPGPSPGLAGDHAELRAAGK